MISGINPSSFTTWAHLAAIHSRFTYGLEEIFEDPFSSRLLPETDNSSSEARYFNLGKTINNRFLFAVFWTDGKRYRVILCREMSDDEVSFYERKNAEWL